MNPMIISSLISLFGQMAKKKEDPGQRQLNATFTKFPKGTKPGQKYLAASTSTYPLPEEEVLSSRGPTPAATSMLPMRTPGVTSMSAAPTIPENNIPVDAAAAVSGDGGMLKALQYFKGGIGAVQAAGGLAGMTGKRPRYEIPSSENTSLGIAKNNSMAMTSPGETATRQRIDQAGANALESARLHGISGLASIPGIAANTQNAHLTASSNTEAWRDRKMTEYMQALGRFSEFQDQKWQMNEFAPYAERMTRSQNAVGAGVQNMFSAGDSQLMAMMAFPELFVDQPPK